MKCYLLEISHAEPKQFRLTTCENGSDLAYADDMSRPDFRRIGLFASCSECMDVLTSYLKLEESK